MVGGSLTGVLRAKGIAVDLGGISGNYSNLSFVRLGLFAICKLSRNFWVAFVYDGLGIGEYEWGWIGIAVIDKFDDFWSVYDVGIFDYFAPILRLCFAVV